VIAVLFLIYYGKPFQSFLHSVIEPFFMHINDENNTLQLNKVNGENRKIDKMLERGPVCVGRGRLGKGLVLDFCAAVIDWSAG
jgi:hypothetical protein